MELHAVKDRLRIVPAPALLKILLILSGAEAFFAANTIYTRNRRHSTDKIKRLHIQHAQAMRYGLAGFIARSLWYRIRYDAVHNPFERDIRAQITHIHVRR